MKRPVIGLTANVFDAEPRRSYRGKALQLADASMASAVSRAGGLPIVIPVTDDERALDQTAELIDGLLLTGGADVDPSSYGQQARGWTGQPARDRFETGLATRIRAARKPILGICRGIQLLNVACGGTLLHDIPTDRPGAERHRDDDVYDQNRHAVRLTPCWLDDLFGGTGAGLVNSVHHQALGRIGDGLEPVAWAADGLVEAVTARSDHWTWAVQWHPEWDRCPASDRLFEGFVSACEGGGSSP